MMPTWRYISGENDARDEIYDLWIVILGDEWYSFLLNDKKYEQWGCPNLIYQLRSNVWLSHSSFLALHKGGRLSCVLSRSLQLLHWTCQLLFGFEMSIFLCERVCMGGWLEGLPAPDEKTPFSMAEVLLKAPRTNLCACERKSRHLQLKVNNANSIGHGLHGGKIKTFFFFFFFIKGVQ